MGSSFFGQLGQKLTGFAKDTSGNMLPTFFNTHQPGGAVGPQGGAYAGVAPSLAGANAGYGGAVQPGANQFAAASQVNPYVYAARNAAVTTGQ